MKQRIGVVVCDTHQLSRNGLIRLLAEEEDIDLLAECDRGEDAIRLVREHRADVLVIDMEIPDLGGLEVARRLRRTDGSSQVILVGMHAEGPIPARALESWRERLPHPRLCAGGSREGCAKSGRRTALRRCRGGPEHGHRPVESGPVPDRDPDRV